jgi:CheY-like chemotaxis protein
MHAMNKSLDPPGEFVELVRDALSHLYDPPYLVVHPLSALIEETEAETPVRGKVLRQAILDAIEALRAEKGTREGEAATEARSGRAYRILELRYIEGSDVADASEQVALSRSQFHRELNRGIRAVAYLLWKRGHVSERWSSSSRPDESGIRGDTAAQLEDQRQNLGLGVSSPSAVDLVGVLAGVSALLRPLCDLRGAELRIALPENLPPILGDRVVLRQALLAILSHAIGLNDRTPIEVEVTSAVDQVEIEISGRSRCPLGSDDLALDESRLFVSALGGSIRYSSPQTDAPAGWSVLLSFEAIRRRTLLVVDNNSDFIRLVDRFLTGQNWRIIGSGDVHEAYDLAAKDPPQSILLDIVIPDRDGWELLLALKGSESTRRIPVIVCSMLDEPAIAFSLGAAAYLQKPIEQRQLISTLAELC